MSQEAREALRDSGKSLKSAKEASERTQLRCEIRAAVREALGKTFTDDAPTERTNPGPFLPEGDDQ